MIENRFNTILKLQNQVNEDEDISVIADEKIGTPYTEVLLKRSRINQVPFYQ